MLVYVVATLSRGHADALSSQVSSTMSQRGHSLTHFPTREVVERRHITINILDCRIITHFPGSDDVVESEHRAGSLRHTLLEVYT